jgi:type VI secretion system protein ImpH
MSLDQDNRTDEDLVALLERDPGRFEAATAFRVAQSAADELTASSNVGVSTLPLPVAKLKRQGATATVETALGGMLGPLGSLPPAYNEIALREKRSKSHALASFLDLFSARMAELFVSAAEKYRLARLLRWDASGTRNAFLQTLYSLTGMGTAKLRERSGIDDEIVLKFSGFFADRTRNAESLGAMLRDLTGLPVDIEFFRGRWLTIPETERSHMTRANPVQLGVNATAGIAVRDYSGGFRVVIGPLDYADYLSFTPDGPRTRELFSLIRLFVGPGLDFDVQIVLKKEQIPFCQLGRAGELPRLGWNSWARVAPAGADSDDVLITSNHVFAQKAS